MIAAVWTASKKNNIDSEGSFSKPSNHLRAQKLIMNGLNTKTRNSTIQIPPQYSKPTTNLKRNTNEKQSPNANKNEPARIERYTAPVDGSSSLGSYCRRDTYTIMKMPKRVKVNEAREITKSINKFAI